jgi:ribosomal protein L29
MNSLLKNLAIVIGEMNEKSRNEILEKLEERNELFRINFEILMAQLADEGKIKLDI